MAASPHPLATQHIPSFVAAPGETDVAMVVMALILGFAVLGFGVVFLRLHTLPERIAHRRHKLQFEIVAVLGLIALFTHMHIFWIAGLLLALIDLPDFTTPLNRIAGSAERMAGLNPDQGADEVSSETSDAIKEDGGASSIKKETLGPTQTEIVHTSQKELSHA